MDAHEYSPEKDPYSCLVPQKIALTGFKRQERHAWEIALPETLGAPQALGLKGRSKVMLFENDQVLGPWEAEPDEITHLGSGRYRHDGNRLIFSTSDNTDPNVNGHSYTVGLTNPKVATPLPRIMHMNLTTTCNFNCQICRPPDFMKTHKAENLADDYIEHLIAEAFPYLQQLRIDSSGEPMASKNFPRVVKAATDYKIPVHVQTNGSYLHQDMVDFVVDSSIEHLWISMDSPHKETLEFIRTGANYERILGGVERLVAARKRVGREKNLSVMLHGALLLQNMDHLIDLLDLGKKLEVDGISLAYGFVHNYMNADWSIFWDRAGTNRRIDEAAAHAKEINVDFRPPKKFDLNISPLVDPYANMAPDAGRKCQYLYNWTYIYPSGKVLPCCVGTYELGDLKNSTFPQIWYSEKYEELRRSHMTPNPSYDKCKNCYLRAGWQPNDYKALFGNQHWEYVEKKLKTQEDLIAAE